MYAQENPVGNFLQQAGSNADIYNGKIEANYNVFQFDNLPYYKNPELTAATIIYRKSYYPRQRVRLDLFKEQLIVSTPDGRYGIVLYSPDVEKVVMYNKTFRWLNPAKESGLKPGFYIHLEEGKKVQLFCKESYTSQQNAITVNSNRNTRFYRFDLDIRYYLLYDNRYYPVKNKGSFTKLFSQYKKQINQFSKEHKLKFEKEEKDESLTSLAGYCDELLTSTSKQ